MPQKAPAVAISAICRIPLAPFTNQTLAEGRGLIGPECTLPDS